MSSTLKYTVIAIATLALSLTAACKDDSSAAKEEVTAGAEWAGKAGVEAGVEAGTSDGAKEGAKEGGTAAAEDVVN